MGVEMKARNISLLLQVVLVMTISCDTTTPEKSDEPVPKCSLTPDICNFGNVTIGEYVDLETILKASSYEDAHIEGTATIDCPGFAFYLNGSDEPADSFEYDLDYPHSYIFYIRFEPTVAGDFECKVDFDTDCGPMTIVGRGIESGADLWDMMAQSTQNDLYDICMDQNSYGIVVGDSGTVLLKYAMEDDFAPWNSYDFGDIKLKSVWKSEGSRFYTAGGEISSDPGWIFMFDVDWGILDSDYMMEYYSSIWGTDDCDMHFGGVNVMSMEGYNLKMYDCDDFSTFELDMGMSDVCGISGSSSSDVWAVLRQPGTNHIYHFNGTGWFLDGEAWMSATLQDVWVSGDGEVFIVGSDGAIYHNDGDVWNDSSIEGFAGTFYGVWGTAANDVFAVGSEASIYHYDGTIWTPQYGPPGLTQDLFSVWGSGSHDVWAVGQGGLILHYD
jgi:hypothetical protein